MRKIIATIVLFSVLISVVGAITVPPEMQDEWDRFTAKYGTNWQILSWNNYLNVPLTPSILSGHYSIGMNITSKEEAEQVAIEFIDDTKGLFKLIPKDLTLQRVLEDFDSFDVDYDQYYNGVLIEHSGFRVLMKKSGDIVRVGNHFRPNISISTIPNITKEEAVQIINESYPPPSWLGLGLVNELRGLVILPKNENGSLNYYLTWKIRFHDFLYFVDAHTGEILKKQLMVIPDSSTLKGTITGEVYPLNDPNGPPSEKPISKVRIWVDDGSWNVKDWTIFDGSYETSDFPDGAYIDFGVSLNANHFGSYSPLVLDAVTVINCGDIPVQRVSECFDGSHDSLYALSSYDFGPGDTYTWNIKFPDDASNEPPIPEGASGQPTIYYNLIRGFEYYYDNLGHFQPFVEAYSGYYKSVADADLTPQRVFYTDANGRSSDIIIHEYTHAVVYTKKGGPIYEDYWTEGAIEEGIGRYFPLSLNNNSVYGEGFPRGDLSPGSPIEIDIADDTLTQAVDLNGDGYFADLGNFGTLNPNEWAFAAALWDIRDDFIGEYTYDLGVENADQLVWEGLDRLDTGGVDEDREFAPRHFYVTLLEEDDYTYGNSDPSDGTPHSFEIWSAFNTHGMQFDDTNPTATITSPSPAQTIYSSTVNVMYTATDDASGVDAIQVRLDTGSWINKNPGSTGHTFYDVADGVHVVYVKAIDRAGNEDTDSVSFTVDSSGTGAIIQYKAHSIDEVVGDGDGNVEPGETIDLIVTLENVGTEDASGVSATLSTSNPDVTITDDYNYFGNIPAGTISDQGFYEFDVSSSAPLGTTIYFNLDITDSSSNSWQDALQIPIGGDVILTTSATNVEVDEIFTLTVQARMIYPNQDWMRIYIDGLSGYIKQCNNLQLDDICTGSIDVSESSPGTYPYQAWAYYYPEMQIEDGNSVDVTVEAPPDTNDPTITITSPQPGSFLNSPSVSVTWSGSDSESGIDHYEVQLDTQGWIDKGTDTNHTFTNVSDGWHDVYVRAFDMSNNTATDSVNFMVDTVAPTTTDDAPTSTWEDPTPSDGKTNTQNWTYLNTTIIDGSNTSAFFDWNNSLKGYWSFDYYNNTGIFDNSTYSNFGMFTGGINTTDIISGKYGESLNFDGGNERLDSGYNFGNDFDDGVTWCAWVKPDNNGTEEYYINSRTSGNSEAFTLGSAGSGLFRFRWATDSGYVNLWSTTSVSVGTWTHLCGAWDKTNISIFVDGTKENESALGGNTDTPTTNVLLGIRSDLLGDYVGSLDEIQIHNRALSPQEINASFNNGLYRLENNFTGVAEGDYNYSAYAIDPAGNLAIGTYRTVTVDTTPPYDLKACQTLSVENGSYILTSNVSSADTCFTIGANNITLDGNGYWINYLDCTPENVQVVKQLRV